MSSASSPKVTALSDFNVNGVLNSLNVREHEAFKIATIRYFYKNMIEGGAFHPDRAQNAKIAAEATVNILGYRLELFDSCKDSFFKKKKFDHDGLFAAIVLDDLMANIHIPSADEDDIEEGYVSAIPGIDDATLARASRIFEMAGDLIENGRAHSDAGIEATFLATMNSISNVDDYMGELETYEEERLKEIYFKELPKLKELASGKNEAGRILARFVEELEEILPDFEGKRLLARFEIPGEDTAKAACLMAAYGQMYDEFSNLEPAFAHRTAEIALIEKLEYKISLFRTFAPEIIARDGQEENLLFTALVLDTQLTDPVGIVEQSRIESSLVFAAATIFEESVDLATNILCHAADVEKESLLLTKLNATAELYSFLEEAEETTPETLAKIREDLPNIEKLAGQDSELDKKLSAFVAQAREEIEAHSPSAAILPFTPRPRDVSSVLNKDFATASIIPLKLSYNIKSVLDKYDFKPNRQVRDILSKFPDMEKTELHQAIVDTINASRMIDQYGETSFSYRQGRISPSIYYAMIARPMIDLGTNIFPDLPEDYASLIEDIDRLSMEPELMYSNDIGPDAKFCHKMETYKTLDRILGHLRAGKFPLDSDQGERVAAEMYRRFVPEAYYTVSELDEISNANGELIREINFIYNNFNHEMCNFITTGMEKGPEILNRDALFQMIPTTQYNANRKVFDAVCDVFEKAHSGLNYDFYYDFAQKIITPANIFYLTHGKTSQNQLDFILAYSAICHMDDADKFTPRLGNDLDNLFMSLNAEKPDLEILKKLELTGQDLEDFSVCAAIADLTFARLYVDGSFATPLFDSRDIQDLYEKANSSKEIMVSNEYLAPVWEACRTNAIECMNTLIETNPEIAEDFKPFPAPSP